MLTLFIYCYKYCSSVQFQVTEKATTNRKDILKQSSTPSVLRDAPACLPRGISAAGEHQRPLEDISDASLAVNFILEPKNSCAPQIFPEQECTVQFSQLNNGSYSPYTSGRKTTLHFSPQRDVTPESRIPCPAGNTLRFPVLSLPPNYGTSCRSILPMVPVRKRTRGVECLPIATYLIWVSRFLSLYPSVWLFTLA